MQHGDTALRALLWLAGVTGIDEQHAVDRFLETSVCVAEEDDVRLRAFDLRFQLRRQRVRRHDVMNEKLSSAQRRCLGEVNPV